MATWAPVVFWILLVPLIVVLLIVYLRGKKTYRLAYILSIFTYAMTIMYWIDSYRLSRNAIIGLLVASSIFMILIGRLLRKQKLKRSMKNIKFAVCDVVLILIIVALSASGIGLMVEKQAVDSILLKDVVIVREEGAPGYQPPAIPVYTITVTNGIIPRQYELPYATACLYNTEKKAAAYADVRWDVSEKYTEFGPSAQALEVFRGSKTATLKIFPGIRYISNPTVPRPVEKVVPATEPEVYNQLLLFLREPSQRDYAYIDCSDIQDFSSAVKIPIR